MNEMPFRRVAIATHYYATGPAFELEDYLRVRTQLLAFVAHPLFPGASQSYLRLYRDGTLADEQSLPGPAGPARYFAELIRTVRWLSTSNLAFDLYVGGDNLLALPGLYMRSRHHVQKVVLYSIDFVPQRFGNPLMNKLYHGVDTFASRRVDVIWNVSDAIRKARENRDGPGSVAPEILVPVGAHVSRIARKTLEQASQSQIAFMGHLLEKQGVQLAIEALPAIRTKIPTATLLVLGDGPYASQLRRLADDRGVRHAVEFAGYVDSHLEIESRLADSALAVAPYLPDATSFTRFADPGKLKAYLACGLPVVVTDVPEFAQTIAAAGAGSIIPYNVDALAAAVVGYLINPEALNLARIAAARLAEQFEWSRIFRESLLRTAEIVETQ